MRTFYRLLISYFLIIFFYFTSYSQQKDLNDKYLATKSGCNIYCKGCSNYNFTATWNGKCQNGLANGYGKLIIYNSNGTERSIYTGTIISGKRSGQAIIIWPADKGYKGIGTFKDNQFYNGKIYYEDGELYSTHFNGEEKLSRIAKLEQELEEEKKKKEEEKKRTPCTLELTSFRKSEHTNTLTWESFYDIKNNSYGRDLKIRIHNSNVGRKDGDWFMNIYMLSAVSNIHYDRDITYSEAMSSSISKILHKEYLIETLKNEKIVCPYGVEKD